LASVRGISYRAQVWLNGTQLDANAVGTFVRHEYNATAAIRPGQTNALAIRVTPPRTAATTCRRARSTGTPRHPT
jgi:hypothetical protein